MKSITGFILYIDILGYKNLLRNNAQSENERVKSLLEPFTRIYTNMNFALGFGASFEESKLFKRYFSDNFLFVYESEREAFLNLENVLLSIFLIAILLFSLYYPFRLLRTLLWKNGSCIGTACRLSDMDPTCLLCSRFCREAAGSTFSVLDPIRCGRNE